MWVHCQKWGDGAWRGTEVSELNSCSGTEKSTEDCLCRWGNEAMSGKNQRCYVCQRQRHMGAERHSFLFQEWGPAGGLLVEFCLY